MLQAVKWWRTRRGTHSEEGRGEGEEEEEREEGGGEVEMSVWILNKYDSQMENQLKPLHTGTWHG